MRTQVRTLTLRPTSIHPLLSTSLFRSFLAISVFIGIASNEIAWCLEYYLPQQHQHFHLHRHCHLKYSFIIQLSPGILIPSFFFIHFRGFLNAFYSVQAAVLQILHLLLTSPSVAGQQDHWDIMVTGHSLGGALSSLCSFELARMKAGTLGILLCDMTRCGVM